MESAEVWQNFTDVIKSPETEKEYSRAVRAFLNRVGMGDAALIAKAQEDPAWIEGEITKVIRSEKVRVEAGAISPNTVGNITAPLRLFLTMNDVRVNWEKLGHLLPRGRSHGTDRAPTLEEIKVLVENADERMKAAVLVMVSSGIRAGAWPSLTWGDVAPCKAGDRVVAASVVVYRGTPEEYRTFITPEAYDALAAYMERRKAPRTFYATLKSGKREFRKVEGEKISPKSALLASQGEPLGVEGLKHLVMRAWRKRGLRTDRVRRHEFKGIHGFRKYFKTHAEQVMHPINVEILMGHAVGVSSSYYKPQEKELLEDYLKAVPYLSITDAYRSKSEVEKKLETEKATWQSEKADLVAQVKELREMVLGIVKDRQAELAANP
jgi:integrase